LHKWINVVRGWKRQYFSLSNGVLKYSQRKKEIEEKAISISLSNAVFLKQRRHTCRFVIDTGNLIFNLRAKTYEKREEWVTALAETQELLKIISKSISKSDRDAFPSPPRSPSQSVAQSVVQNRDSAQSSSARNIKFPSIEAIKEPKEKERERDREPVVAELTLSTRDRMQEQLVKLKKTKQELKQLLVEKSDVTPFHGCVNFW